MRLDGDKLMDEFIKKAHVDLPDQRCDLRGDGFSPSVLVHEGDADTEDSQVAEAEPVLDVIDVCSEPETQPATTLELRRPNRTVPLTPPPLKRRRVESTVRSTFLFNDRREWPCKYY